ncbi:NADPH oxidase family protein [Phanerochaete sordida]|uniref:NADPH oxidase family protein n=1 Tax=Phanerochaete sordida TaxID=48140 RepID=A0A9P3LDQ0_9APHY|nr:NADPH oxidase family protein [Phanerochaete sordida]
MSTLPSSSPSANLTLPAIPNYPDDLEWVTAYLAQHMLSESSWVYAWILWIIVAAAFLTFSIMHWAGFRGGYLGAVWSKWAFRRRTWRKKRSAAKAGQPYRQPDSLPSNAQLLAVCTLFAVVLVLSFAGPDYLAPGARLWNYHSYPVASNQKRDYNTDDYMSLQPQFTIPKAWWTSGGRTGLIAFALFPLTVLFALKAPPFAIFSSRLFTQLGFDKLAFLHRWCGFLVWFLATLHSVFWSVQLASDRRSSTRKAGYIYAWQYDKFIYAWTAYGCFTLLMLCSLPAIRRHHYEAFWFMHVLFVPLTLILSALHHPPLAAWCYAALALWVGERCYRFTWWLNTNGYLGGKQLYEPYPSQRMPPSQAQPETVPMHSLGQPGAVGKLPMLPRIDPLATPPAPHQASMAGLGYSPPPGYAHAELMPGKTVRVRIVTAGFLSWAPGQHFLVHIPAISRFTSHPFTCASVCDTAAPHSAGRELVFFIRAKKGWTKDLWDAVAHLAARGLRHAPGERAPAGPLPPKGVLLRACVDGPFGSAARARWGEHASVLLMAGGSGVSFALAILAYVCMCMAGRDGRELGGRRGGFGVPGFKTRRVRFVWIVREFGHVHWCAQYLRRCMMMVPPHELQIDIFVTNAKPMMRALSTKRVPGAGLAPPAPRFVLEDAASEKRAHSPAPDASDTDDDDADADSMLDLSYYESDVADVARAEHALDLTNFEDDDDSALPGEAALSAALRDEGRHRRSVWRQSMAPGAGARGSFYSTVGAADPRASFYSTMGAADPRASFYSTAGAPGVRSSVRLLEEPRAFAAQVHTPSPLSVASTSTPTSAHPLLGGSSNNNSTDSPQAFSFPPPPAEARRVSFAGTRAESPRPLSVLSQASGVSGVSDAHSLAALVSASAAAERIRLDLDAEDVADIGVVAERARGGRPNFDKILADEVAAAGGALAVGCCGPTSLNAVVRKSVAAQIDPGRIRAGDLRGQISLVAEDFGY